jgi:iron complex outermembrane receptor protein
MKATIITLLLVCFVKITAAQITGKVTDSTGQPLAFANIILLKGTDSSFLKAVLPDEKGLYSIAGLGAGSYLIRISNAGYENWHSPLFKIDTQPYIINLGTTTLKADAKELEAVVVQSAKQLFQQQPFGITVNTEASLLTKGSSVLQVLERSPGVALDYRNNSISLNGKEGVMVMLNGKLIRMASDQVVALLAGMSADNVEKIELMTSPPAGFDAEGNAGIINIVLKKNRKKGTNGSVSLTAGYGWREKAAASINLAHNTARLNLYGSYSFFRDRAYSELFIPSAQNMPVLGGELEVLVWDTTRATQQNHDLTLGMDWKIDPGNTAGINLSLSNSARSSSNFSNSDFTIFPDSLLFYDGYITGTNRWKNLAGNLYLERKLSEQQKINFSFDYLWFRNNSPTEVQSSFVNSQGDTGNNDSMFSSSQQGFANTTIRTAVIKIDYSNQLNKKMQMDWGVKGTYARTASSSGIKSLVDNEWITRNETLNNITVAEPIVAAYTSFTAALNEDIHIVAGLRFEYSSTQMKDAVTKEKLVERKLGALFPNISLTRKWNERSELILSWSKRISRPSYNDLASFIRYSDPTAVYTGNPLLKPAITNNLDLRYNYRSYGFAFLYSLDNNPIVRYQITESPQRQLLFVSPQNMAWQHNINLQASIPVKVTTWWNMNYSVIGGWRKFRVIHTKQLVEKAYYAWSANFSQSFKIPKQFSAEISGWYNSMSYNGTIRVEHMGALNLGIKKELQNNKGSFQLSVTDVFQTMKIHTSYGSLTEEAFSIRNNVYIDLESSKSPIFKLSYTRSFGSGNNQHKQAGSAKDEKERVRND